MGEYTQITLGQWMSWKEDIRQKLAETAGNFVHIGYRLKQIRDSGMYDGAEDIFGFARKEYGLGKSTVSRFIAINEKFSEGGDSLELKKEFRGFSSSKLAEMLTLPDEEIAMITEKTTVKEIRDLKNFDRQGGQEIRGGGQDTGEKEQGLTALQKCITGYFRDKKRLLNEVMKAVHADDIKGAAELINPTGYGTYHRGLIYIFFYSYEQGIRYKQFGRDGITQMSWSGFLKDVYDVYGEIYESGSEDIHGAYYGGLTGDPVATSQQEEGEKPQKTTAETISEQEEEDEKRQERAQERDREDPDTSQEQAVAAGSGDDEDETGAGAGGAERQYQARSIFGKVLYQIGKDDPEKFLDMHEALYDNDPDASIQCVAEDLADVLAPEERLIVDIAGEGRKMLVIIEADTDPVLVDINSGDVQQSCTWDHMIDELQTLIPEDEEDGRKAFEMVYGAPFPEKKEAAEEQQERQIEGQMEITDFPEYMPQGYKSTAGDITCAGSSADVDDAEGHDAGPGPLISQDGMEMHIKNQTELIRRDLYKMLRQCSDREWDRLIKTAEGIIERAEGIGRMTEVYAQ